MGIRSPVTPRMRRVRRAIPARRAIVAIPANRKVQRARDRKSHHRTPRLSAPPAMPRQIRLRRWKGNSLQDCTPPMAKTIRPRITPAGHQRMPTGRGGVVGSGDSNDMEGVFLPIRSRQALAETIPMDRSRSMGLTTPGADEDGREMLRECRWGKKLGGPRPWPWTEFVRRFPISARVRIKSRSTAPALMDFNIKNLKQYKNESNYSFDGLIGFCNGSSCPGP